MLSGPVVVKTLDGPVPRVLVPAVEKRVREKAEELRLQLAKLVEKIEVSNFRTVQVENGLERVVWDVHIPPTLITLANQLIVTLSPNDG